MASPIRCVCVINIASHWSGNETMANHFFDQMCECAVGVVELPIRLGTSLLERDPSHPGVFRCLPQCSGRHGACTFTYMYVRAVAKRACACIYFIHRPSINEWHYILLRKGSNICQKALHI